MDFYIAFDKNSNTEFLLYRDMIHRDKTDFSSIFVYIVEYRAKIKSSNLLLNSSIFFSFYATGK